jgi:hypothetical protein
LATQLESLLEKYSVEINQLPVLSPVLESEEGVYPGQFWCQVRMYKIREFFTGR